MYDKQTAEFIATIGQNVPVLSNQEMQYWIGRPLELQKFLAGLCPPPSGFVTDFKVWKTLKIGTDIKNADGYRRAIKGKKVGNQKMDIGDYADDILDKPAFSVAARATELDLCVATVKELTGKDEAPLKEIFAAIKQVGGQLCPNQVGPELRLQYEDQPKGEWLAIGMEPITGSSGSLDLFCVVRLGDDLWLGTDCDNPHGIWHGSIRFVFVLPRK